MRTPPPCVNISSQAYQGWFNDIETIPAHFRDCLTKASQAYEGSQYRHEPVGATED